MPCTPIPPYLNSESDFPSLYQNVYTGPLVTMLIIIKVFSLLKWLYFVQVLALVNDIPVTSRKYEFARDLADKIIEENDKQGDHVLKEINRMALSNSFARTLKLLNSSLYGMQRVEETSSWTWKLFRMIPLYSQLMPSFENIWFSLANGFLLQPPPPLFPSQTQNTNNNNSVLAEKLAQELLWITKKLQVCLAMEEAILQWSSATNLATLSISSNPRVQGSLVKISGKFLSFAS